MLRTSLLSPLTIIPYQMKLLYTLQGKKYMAYSIEYVVYLKDKIRYCTRRDSDLQKIDQDIRNSEMIYMPI